MDNLFSALENLSDKYAVQQKELIAKYVKSHNTVGDIMSALKVDY